MPRISDPDPGTRVPDPGCWSRLPISGSGIWPIPHQILDPNPIYFSFFSPRIPDPHIKNLRGSEFSFYYKRREGKVSSERNSVLLLNDFTEIKGHHWILFHYITVLRIQDKNRIPVPGSGTLGPGPRLVIPGSENRLSPYRIQYPDFSLFIYIFIPDPDPHF